jgi:hypothetical protein
MPKIGILRDDIDRLEALIRDLQSKYPDLRTLSYDRAAMSLEVRRTCFSALQHQEDTNQGS